MSAFDTLIAGISVIFVAFFAYRIGFRDGKNAKDREHLAQVTIHQHK